MVFLYRSTTKGTDKDLEIQKERNKQLHNRFNDTVTEITNTSTDKDLSTRHRYRDANINTNTNIDTDI